MKRSLLAITALYLLYHRQKQVEGRILNRQFRQDKELREWSKGVSDNISRFVEEVNKQQQRFVEEVNRALGGVRM